MAQCRANDYSGGWPSGLHQSARVTSPAERNATPATHLRHDSASLSCIPLFVVSLRRSVRLGAQLRLNLGSLRGLRWPGWCSKGKNVSQAMCRRERT